jgi:hypothetical protein
VEQVPCCFEESIPNTVQLSNTNRGEILKRRTTFQLLIGGGALSTLVVRAFGLEQAMATSEATNQQRAMATSEATNQQRAIASYVAMQKYFYQQDGSRLYLERYPVQAGDNTYSHEWPFSQAHIATMDLAFVPGLGSSYRADLSDRLLGQEHYWNTTGTTGLPGYDSSPRPPYGKGGSKFYDDNEWVGLARLQYYLLTGNSAALERSKDIFRLVVSGWDTNPSHPAPGGVFWTQASWNHRNTVSNMPGTQIGLRLYLITHESYYLDWALKMYEWTNTYLLAPHGLYWDHINLDGTLDKTLWSYNQGVPVGVNVLLYKATGDQSYLNKAQQLARTALDYYGSLSRLYSQPPYFNSIFFKNLLLLQSVDHNPRYLQAMQAYGDTMWSKYLDPTTGLIRFGTKKNVQLLEQAAMTQIYSVLSWSPSSYALLY